MNTPPPAPAQPASAAGARLDFHPGRLVMVDFQGTRLTGEQKRFLQQHHIGGVCLFRRNLGDEDQVRTLVAELSAALGPGALIAIDQEGGTVIRVTSLPQAPSAMALGAADDPGLAGAVGAAVARGLRSLGFNWNFAPVLDVNNNPANPVIAERSFGADPHRVARLAGAWMRGSLQQGVACCVKHFPGHGDTHVDSHHDLPCVDKPRSALEKLELLPFRTLLADTPAIMSAHIVYPGLDPALPATLSPEVLGRLLRDTWSYDGVVITDSLVMDAIHRRFGHPRAAVMALAAGADMVMALGPREDQEAALQAVEQAFARGELPRARGVAACARLDRLATTFPAVARNYDPAERAQDEALMRRAWALGLTAVRGAQPPAISAPLRVISQRQVPSDGVSEAGPDGAAVRALFAEFGAAVHLQVDDLAGLQPATLPPHSGPTVLVSNHRQRYGPEVRGWCPDLHVALWNPFQVLDIGAPALLTWGFSDGALDAARAWLGGRTTAPGRAPVALPAPCAEPPA